MSTWLCSLRLLLLSGLLILALYLPTVLVLSRLLFPGSAAGSLLTDTDGRVRGSRLLAQGFEAPGYFWPRPSAVGYAADAAGGSNLSPLSPALTERAKAEVARHGADSQRPLPLELATASGSGLDPHIGLAAALYQAPRVAAARGLPIEQVEALVEELAERPGWPLWDGRLANVLELNLTLDIRFPPR